MEQLRVLMLQLKISHAATKTQSSQKKKKRRILKKTGIQKAEYTHRIDLGQSGPVMTSDFCEWAGHFDLGDF